MNDILLKMAVAAQAASHSAGRRARREDGQGTLEWILIALSIALLAWVAYKALGGQISSAINRLTEVVRLETGNGG